MYLKKLIPYLLFAVLLTGCLDASNSSDCVPVDERAFLAEYAQQEGVVERDSGLLYRVIEEGEGEIPKENEVVFVNFTLSLITGETFAETGDLTFFTLNNDVLAGIREALTIMKEGSTYELVLPPELAYGNRPPAGTPIRCGAVLVVEITLDSFLRDVDTYLSENAARDDVNVTESGLQYRVIEEGDGDSPNEASSVRIRYRGELTNGIVFDQTTGNNTVTFGVSGLIAGFTEGLLLMSEGSKYEFFIPPNLGYGNQPQGNVIPANSILVFEVELVEVL
jgi:FKBP-type peptidyl-prolyl cis-trans isomerase